MHMGLEQMSDGTNETLFNLARELTKDSKEANYKGMLESVSYSILSINHPDFCDEVIIKVDNYRLVITKAKEGYVRTLITLPDEDKKYIEPESLIPVLEKLKSVPNQR